jgi:hypothetical protein
MAGESLALSRALKSVMACGEDGENGVGEMKAYR